MIGFRSLSALQRMLDRRPFIVRMYCSTLWEFRTPFGDEFALQSKILVLCSLPFRDKGCRFSKPLRGKRRKNLFGQLRRNGEGKSSLARAGAAVFRATCFVAVPREGEVGERERRKEGRKERAEKKIACTCHINHFLLHCSCVLLTRLLPQAAGSKSSL